MPAADRNAAIAAAIDAIETEMRRIGFWDAPAPSAERIARGGAFGTGSMTFSQWLRFVFVPRVRAILVAGADGEWPKKSQVAAQAAREWGHSPSPFETDTLE